MNLGFLNSSLVFKLVFLFVITTIIPILVSGYITFEISKATLQDETVEKLETIAELKTQRIVENFELIKADMLAVASYPDIKTHISILKSHYNDWTHPEYLESKKILNDQLIEFQKAKAMVIDIMLINEDGKIVYNTNPDHGSKELGLLLPDPGNHAFTEGQKGTFIAPMFKNYLENYEPYMLLSTPVHGFDDEFLGVMTFELDMNLVYEIVTDSSGLGETGENYIATKTPTGAIFLSPPESIHSDIHPEIHTMQTTDVSHDFTAVLNYEIPFGDSNGVAIQSAVNGENFAGVTQDYLGNQVVAVGTYIPLLDWGMVSKIDSSEAFAPIAYLEQINLFLAIMFTVVVGVIGFIASRNVANPIKKLNKSAQHVAKGDFALNVSHKGNDELALFINSFNGMLTKLGDADSQQKEYQIKLEDMVMKLKQQEQEKDEFTSMISHELKTPLSPILNWTEVMLKGLTGDLTEKQRHALTKIDASSKKLLVLIQDILDVHKLELGQLSFNISEFDINELFSEIVEDYKTEKSLTCSFEIDSESIIINSDNTRITQVVKNFVNNALDFLPANDPKIILSSKDQGEFVWISVKDNGVGISDDAQKNLFKKFYQVDTSANRKHGGTGLGLSICMGISTGLGGEIGVNSKVGQGSEFFIKIPKEYVKKSITNSQ